MGLAERRKIKEIQDDVLPGRVKEIEEICGKPISYEVDWDSLAIDAAGLNFLDNISCHRLNMALRTICIDDLGKEAVREGLMLIKLKNVADVTACHIGRPPGRGTDHGLPRGAVGLQGAVGAAVTQAIGTDVATANG